jgi:8-oxo-dGTP diphosphatase
MPHIHTESGQHDITTSAWIFREDEDELRALVHMHRKHGKLMQIGGHIELDETPWQTLAHELPEESGFVLEDLDVLQPHSNIATIPGATVHPVPAIMNTHLVNPTHYHSDLGYAFIAKHEPSGLPAEGESQDLRWMTINELKEAALGGLALRDVVAIYEDISVNIIPIFHRIPATNFSVDKPASSLLSSE